MAGQPVERRAERLLADVAEGRMSDVVRKARRLDEIRIRRSDLLLCPRCLSRALVFVAQSLGGTSSELRDLQGVSQARVVQAIFVARYDLGLAGQATEGAGVDDAVAVTRELSSDVATASALVDAPLKREVVVRQKPSL